MKNWVEKIYLESYHRVEGGPKTFFRKPPRHCAALVRMVSGGAGMLNPSRLGARAAVEAVSIVHDIRYVA